MIIYRQTVLKSTSDTKAENTFLFSEKYARQFLDESLPCIWIIRVDQTKRHIHDRHLDSQLAAETRTIIAQAGEEAFREADNRIGLRFAAQENLLEAKWQSGQWVNRANPQSVIELVLCD